MDFGRGVGFGREVGFGGEVTFGLESKELVGVFLVLDSLVSGETCFELVR